MRDNTQGTLSRRVTVPCQSQGDLFFCGDNNKANFFRKGFDFSKKIHMVGIGGVSMFSLAVYLKMKGWEISGSDTRKSTNTKTLKKLGIKVYDKHQQNNVKNADIVIYSYAVENNVEVETAKRLGLMVLSRAEVLGQILKNYKTSICVSGAHGKTTTTALIYETLKRAGKKVSLHLGGQLVESGKSYDYLGKDIIVCEACEYKDAFLNFSPTVGVILNIAPEHLDYFGGFENVKKSFGCFAQKSKMLICSSDVTIPHANKITFKNQGFTAKNIKMVDGKQNFDCFVACGDKEEFYHNFTLNLVGKHNIQNALAVISVADNMGISKQIINSAFTNFLGIKRRFEILSKTPVVVHDYAHHPDEIAAAVQSMKDCYGDKVYVVFQPHTYSRTKTLMQEFKKCFESVDVGMYRTYSARENYQKSGSAKTLAKNVNCKYINSQKELLDVLKKKITQGFSILILGAGNIDVVAKRLTRILIKERLAFVSG